jgi:FKBP-type peptidyl-prolyl cis-trans isomerase (trigger factor)
MTKSILAKQTNEEIQITITIPKEEIAKNYVLALDDIVKEAELPGFRKGKAPRNLVEEKTDKSHIYEHMMQKIVPQAYVEAVKEHSLQPIVSPKVELLKAKEGEDWEIRATTCEQPKIDLGDYKESIKKLLASTKLWKPGDKEESTKVTDEEKQQKVIQALLDSVKVEVPDILVEDEVNRSLSSLLSQTQSLGLNIDQYLTSVGKTPESIRQEYREKAITSYKLQFALDKIAMDEKIEVSEKEIEDMVNVTGDEKVKKEFEDPYQKAYLKSVIMRRKALDSLSRL